jgi:hypothetical protein
MTLYVQYQKAVRLQQLVTDLEPNLVVDAQAFYDNFFNILTCGSDGLDNWGLLLDRSRTIPVPALDNVFGFGDVLGLPVAPTYPQNYDHGSFYSGSSIYTALTDPQYRTLLQFTYAYLTSNFSLMSANLIMNAYCATFENPVTVQVSTTGPKQMEFLITGTLEPWQSAIFALPGVLPIPMGVQATLT